MMMTLSPRILNFTTRPQRAIDILPERVFLCKWAELVTGGILFDIISPFLAKTERKKPLTDRDIKVSCSIVQWFGTKEGICFLDERVPLHIKRHRSLTYAFKLAWIEVNTRCGALNQGYIPLELILTEKHMPKYPLNWYDKKWGPAAVSLVSARDEAIALATILSFSTPEGQLRRSSFEHLLGAAEQVEQAEYHWCYNLGIIQD